VGGGHRPPRRGEAPIPAHNTIPVGGIYEFRAPAKRKDPLFLVIEVAVAAGLADIDGVNTRYDEPTAIAPIDPAPFRHRRFESFD